MSSLNLISAYLILILGLQLINALHLSQPRRVYAPIPEDYSDSDEPESYESFEMGNPNDRSIGFGKTKATKATKFPFYPTPQTSYTQQPDMFKRLEAKGYNDVDDIDKDYYAHYDFEFAKSGILHANFQQKYLTHQAKHIGKPLVDPNAAPPPTGDDAFGGYGTKPVSKGEKNARGLFDGGLLQKGSGGDLQGGLLGVGGSGGTGGLIL